MSTHFYRARASERSRKACYTIIERTWPLIPSGRLGCAKRSRPCSSSGNDHDTSFITPGAEAYRHDLPNAEIDLLDAGHFALDEKVDEIARRMTAFLEKLDL